MMGGAFNVTKYGFGNITPAAEFNIYTDPEAALIVLKSGLHITAVGLDVTMDPSALITQKEYEKIRSAKTKSAELVRRITRSHMASFGSLALHDPMAVAVAIDPSLVTRKKYFVEVETRGEYTRGQTIADRRGNLRPKTVRVGNPITLCTSVLGEKFIKLFMNRVVLQTQSYQFSTFHEALKL
jgi:purine nucleosidase